MHNTSVVISDAICCGCEATLFIEIHLGSCPLRVPIWPQRIINTRAHKTQWNEKKNKNVVLRDHSENVSTDIKFRKFIAQQMIIMVMMIKID